MGWDRDKCKRSGDVCVKCDGCDCDCDCAVVFCGGVEMTVCVDGPCSLSYREGELRKGVDTDGMGKGKLLVGRLWVDNRVVVDDVVG